MPDEKLRLSSIYGEMLNSVKNTDDIVHHDPLNMYGFLLNKTYDEYKKKIDNTKNENKEESKGRGMTTNYFFCDDDLADSLFISESVARNMKTYMVEGTNNPDVDIVTEIPLEKGDKIVGRYGNKNVALNHDLYAELQLNTEPRFIDINNGRKAEVVKFPEPKGFKVGEFEKPFFVQPRGLNYKSRLPLYYDYMYQIINEARHRNYDQMMLYAAENRKNNKDYKTCSLKTMELNTINANKRSYLDYIGIEDIPYIPYDPYVSFSPTLSILSYELLYKDNKYSFEYYMMKAFKDMILFHDIARKYIEYRIFHSIDYDLLLIYKVGGHFNDGKQQVYDTTNVQRFFTEKSTAQYSRPWIERKGIQSNSSFNDTARRMGVRNKSTKKKTRSKKFR